MVQEVIALNDYCLGPKKKKKTLVKSFELYYPSLRDVI